MRKYQRLTIIILLITILSSLSASDYPGAVFLMIWPGARPTGLAGAFSAIADDASAAYYNVGGLGFFSKSHATIMHSNWLPGLYAGMFYDYLGFCRPLHNQGTIGANVIYINTGETEVTDFSGTPLGEYTTFDFAISGSYGFKINPQVGVGVSAKFIYSFLVPDWVWQAMPELGIEAGGTGVSWAFDAGILYKPWDFLSVGVSVNNIGPNISYTSSSESDPLPRMLRTALCYTPVRNNTMTLNITPEITTVLVGLFKNKTFAEEWQETWKSFGVEAWFYNIFAARFGYFEDIKGQRGGISVVDPSGRQEHISLTEYLFDKGNRRYDGKIGACLGFGVQYAGFVFDVSYDGFIYDFTTQNWKFSLTYQFQ